MNLILKVHPRCLAWKIGNDVGTVALHKNLLKNYEEIKKLFLMFKSNFKLQNIYFENPHIELAEDSLIKTYSEIQHIQRLVGVLQILSWDILGVIPNSLIPIKGYSMIEKIEMYVKFYPHIKMYFDGVERVCLVECYLLEKGI